MNEHLDDFLIYIGSEKGLSQNTIEAYTRDGLAFIKFLETLDLQEFQMVESQHIVDFLASLHAKGYAVSSISRNLITIKVLFRFLKREGAISNNPAFYIDTPKLWQLIPEVLSCEEVERLLNMPDPAHPTGARDKAILELLYSSGLRVSEVCRIKIYDVDDSYVKVFGKGSKERIVPLGKFALQAIDHYLRFRDNFESEEQKTLFVTKGGRPVDRIYVWRMIKEYGRKGNIQKNISPHTLRHSFATHLLDNGAELRVIQEMLGHASITSTERYTHISHTHLLQAFERFHPRK